MGIYFYSVEVKEIFPATDRVKLLADEFEFFARKVLVTTNGYASKLLPAVDVVPARAQVLVTSAVEGLKLHGTFHFDKGFYYFRNIGDKILLGGARNSDFTGETTVELKLTDGIQQKLEYMLREVILPGQEFTIEQQWSGIMGMGAEKKPVVKKVDKNLFCAVRMSGMGVAIGSLVGKEAAEMMSEELI